MEWTVDECGTQTAHFGPFMLEVGVDDEFPIYWGSVIAEIHPATREDQAYWDSIEDKGNFLTIEDAKAWFVARAKELIDIEDANNEQLIRDLEEGERAWAEWMERTYDRGEL
jgi:hypothetical protein